MLVRLSLAVLLMFGVGLAQAAERSVLRFQLLDGTRVLESNLAVVADETRTWSRGLDRSYLRQRCHTLESGAVERRLSTENLFSGMRIKHRLNGDHIEVEVTRNVVKPVLTEIRQTPKGECRDLEPVATVQQRSYRLPIANEGSRNEPFVDTLSFKFTVQRLLVAK